MLRGCNAAVCIAHGMHGSRAVSHLARRPLCTECCSVVVEAHVARTACEAPQCGAFVLGLGSLGPWVWCFGALWGAPRSSSSLPSCLAA